MKETFYEIETRKTRKGNCSTCGKKTTRVVKVSQTVNPFNKRDDGQPKTREDIARENVADLAAKLAEPLLCSGCES